MTSRVLPFDPSRVGMHCGSTRVPLLMRSFVPHSVLGCLVVVVAACATRVAPPAPLAVAATTRTSLVVELGNGLTTAAEVVFPAPGGAHGDGPYPVVLMIAGNGPHDMDTTMPGPGGATTLFRDVAEIWAERGFATVRYHKRRVKGPGKFDARFWREQSTETFSKDANKVLDAALVLPQCDKERVCVFGWSEGTVVGAALAIERGDVRAIVFQGPVAMPYRELVRSWIVDVGLPYARGTGTAIDADSLRAATRGNGGMVSKLTASWFADPSRGFGPPAVNPRFDTNGDGALDAETEASAAVEPILDWAFSPQGACWIYAPGRVLPQVVEQAPRLRMPTLILQGDHDASTPLRGARALEAALRESGNTRAELRVFENCGHSLGTASSLIDDAMRKPDAAIFVGAAEWLAASLRG